MRNEKYGQYVWNLKMTLSAKKVKDILLIFKSATTYLGFKTRVL